MSRRNIGVAIAVPEPFGPELQGWRERFGDPNADGIVPHVTLLPPTLVAEDRLAAIESHLRRVAADAQPFVIELRGSATFRPVSPVVFVPLVRGISECEHLERGVRSGPLARATRFPYHPHVTVAHDVGDEDLDRAFRELTDYLASFTVFGFTLFCQDRAGAWQVRAEFPFLGGGPVRPRATARGW